MPHSWTQFMAELHAADAAEGPQAVADSAILHAHYELANRIYQGRCKRGLSQQALASASGIDQAEISRIERGASNPTMATVVRLLTALGLRVTFPRRTARAPSKGAASKRALPRRYARTAKRSQRK